MNSYDHKAVLAEKVEPLLAQIVAICKEHGIPHLMVFQETNDAEGGDLRVSADINTERGDSHAMAIATVAVTEGLTQAYAAILRAAFSQRMEHMEGEAPAGTTVQ